MNNQVVSRRIKKVSIGSVCSNPGHTRRRITGQGMTEYIIIVALIAIASIAAVNFFGNSVQATFAGMAGTLAGKGGDDGRRLAEEAARKAEEESQVQNTLSNYDS